VDKGPLVNQFIEKFEYDNNNFQIFYSQIFWDIDSSKYLNGFRSYITNNAEGYPVLIEKDDTYDNLVWTKSNIEKYEYYQSHLDTLWIEFKKSYLDTQALRRTKYLPDGRMTHQIIKKRYGKDLLIDREILNNYENGLIVDSTYRIYFNEVFLRAFKVNFTYDSIGRLKSKTRSSLDLTINLEWKLEIQNLYFYDGADSKPKIEIVYNFDAETNSWKEVDKSFYTYYPNETIITNAAVDPTKKSIIKTNAENLVIYRSWEVKSGVDKFKKIQEYIVNFGSRNEILDIVTRYGNVDFRDTVLYPTNYKLYGYNTTIDNNEFSSNYSISIFPNPSHGLIQFNLNDYIDQQNLNWHIIDNTGKAVKSGISGPNQKFIDINGLHIGMYNLLIQSKNGRAYSGSFVKIE
jgi:hypothetical protein